jgi:outer membrane putative beta-barrel porin/alpha-amylase
MPARILLFALAALAAAAPARAQNADPSRKWEIVDNSFLVEESFNQERGVFQNIFTWVLARDGSWAASFTQEWPAPGVAHQLSYTLVAADTGTATGFGDVLVNYRYQLRNETAGGPAISPRLSVILPTGRADRGLGDDVVGLQVNVPASKQFGDFYLHANAGFTWLPDVQKTPHVAGSGIWRVAPMLNLMLEAFVALDDFATISPGFRRGWNIGDHQLVVGAAVPFTRQDGETTAALLTYFSYELPFKR